jgi:hypothetical protein
VRAIEFSQTEPRRKQGCVQLALRASKTIHVIPFATEKVLISDNIGTVAGAWDSPPENLSSFALSWLPHLGREEAAAASSWTAESR